MSVHDIDAFPQDLVIIMIVRAPVVALRAYVLEQPQVTTERNPLAHLRPASTQPTAFERGASQ